MAGRKSAYFDEDDFYDEEDDYEDEYYDEEDVDDAPVEVKEIPKIVGYEIFSVYPPSAMKYDSLLTCSM